MENNINKIITLANGKEFYVLKQAIYKNENYYMVAEVTEDGQDLKEKFAMLHELVKEGQEYLELVKDPKTMQILLTHLNAEEE